jgi:hypothetical protein
MRILWLVLLEMALASCLRPSRLVSTLRMSVNSEMLSQLGQFASTYCGLNGILYSATRTGSTGATGSTRDATHLLLEPAPTALLPTPYPKDMYQYAKLLQPIINELVDKISRDRAFLRV